MSTDFSAQPEPQEHAVTTGDFRRWWRETGSASPAPSPEMLQTANEWAEYCLARWGRPTAQPPANICTGCGSSRADAIKAIAAGSVACCPDCSTLTVEDRNAIRDVAQSTPPAAGEVAELVKRIKELAHAVTNEDWREFTMRVPAEPLRDADLVLTRAAELLERQHPQPVVVSERLPGQIEQALIKAECALADIAEGEAENSEGDPLEWAEKRATDALARIRPVMRQHQIHTSEWPLLPAHAPPGPDGEEGDDAG